MSCEYSATQPATAFIRYPSLRQTLANGLAQAIAPFSPPHREIPTASSIPLEVITHAPPGLFRSPIALQLASRTQQPAMVAGRQILTDFHRHLHPSHPHPKPGPMEVQLWLQSPGWIYIQCSERTLAAWLQLLLHSPPTLIALPWTEESPSASPPTISPPHSEQLFKLQVAHARCCALLRLADRERILTLPMPQPSLGSTGGRSLNKQLPGDHQGDLQIAPTIAWVDPQHHLYLQAPSEQALIHQLLQFPSALIPQAQVWITPDLTQNEQTLLIPWPIPPTALWRYAQTWSEQLLAFDRDCQIFGQVSAQIPALAQARLGLVYATQRVLAFILRTLLQVDAPIEL